MIPGQVKTLYRVTFKDYNGTPYHLDTFDAAKIGPWLADLYGQFPYTPVAATTVDVQASTFRT